MKTIYYLLLLCSNIVCLYAQETTTYDIHSGLPHWIVSGIAQDKYGFIWLSTWNGLCRYDGYEFCVIKTQPGDGTDISSEVIRTMTADNNGGLICHTNNETFRFDTKEYKLQDLPSKKPYIRKHGKPAPFRDREGNLWQAVRYGVTKTVTDHHPAILVEGTEDVQARAFMKDNRSRWWLATKEDKCIRIYGKDSRLIGFLGADGHIHKDKVPFGHSAYCMMQTGRGDVWIGCKPGALFRLRPVSDSVFSTTRIKTGMCDTIYHITEDKAGRLWIASFGGGVQCIPKPAAAVPKAIGFNSGNGVDIGGYKVRRILTTQTGDIVCATTNGLIVGTIDKKDIKRSVFRTITRDGKRKESLCNNATIDLARDSRGRIYIATENNGIDMTDEKSILLPNPAFTHFNTSNSSLTSDACLSMAVKDNGRIFIVCPDRVMDFDPANDETTTYARSFWSDRCHFSEERPLQLFDGSWIFGQEQGAYIVTRKSMDTKTSMPPLYFTRLDIDGKGRNIGICAKDTIIIDTDERNFSVSFAALCYNNSEVYYRSRIGNSQWTHASRMHSRTFYDIRPGIYVLEVQSTDRYGRWTENNRKIVLVVKAHWYETVYAKAGMWLFIICFITSVVYTLFYIRYLKRQRSELLGKYMSLLDNIKGNEEKNAGKDEELLSAQLTERDNRFLQLVRTYIEENIANSDANIDEMAAFAATSRSNLNRRLRSLVGITAAQLLIDARMQRACQLLRSRQDNSKPSIAEVAFGCGYSDTRYFSRCFKQKYNVTPSEYAEGGE